MESFYAILCRMSTAERPDLNQDFVLLNKQIEELFAFGKQRRAAMVRFYRFQSVYSRNGRQENTRASHCGAVWTRAAQSMTRA